MRKFHHNTCEVGVVVNKKRNALCEGQLDTKAGQTLCNASYFTVKNDSIVISLPN